MRIMMFEVEVEKEKMIKWGRGGRVDEDEIAGGKKKLVEKEKKKVEKEKRRGEE